MAEPRLAYLEFRTFNAAVEVRINDAPVFRFDERESYRAFIPFPSFVVRGRNRLSLQLWRGAPPPPPPTDQEPPEIATVRAALYGEGERAFEEGSGTTLASLALRTEPRRETVFESPIGPERWSWMDADPLDEAALRSPELLAVLKQLRTALLAADPAPIIDAANVRLADSAAAFGNHTEAQFRAMTADAITQLEPAPAAPEPPPLAPALAGDGRLVNLLATDGEPWLRRPRQDGSTFTFPAVLARLKGAWKIVR